MLRDSAGCNALSVHREQFIEKRCHMLLGRRIHDRQRRQIDRDAIRS